MKNTSNRLLNVLITVIISTMVFGFTITAEAGQVAGFNTYKSCIDDSECGDDGYCVNGKCMKSKEKKGCVDDSECGEGGYCVGGECKETKKW